MKASLVRARDILRHEGARSLLSRVLAKASRLVAPHPALGERPAAVDGGAGRQVQMLVRYDDARDVDWTTPTPGAARVQVVENDAVAWIMSPPGESSGGHQNLFRFIRFLEDAGHRCTVNLYSAQPYDLAGVKAMLASSTSYDRVEAPILPYGTAGVGRSTKAVFATGWETAYPAYRDASEAKRFYFVQDYEPLFYPMGAEYVLAENTYRFGFHGITAGRWLARRLSQEFGMSTDHFDFGADKARYWVTGSGSRDELFFYARPVTARRGFELGLMTLDLFARERPECTINLAGWDVSDWQVPFAHNNLGSVPVPELNELYNRCGVALVMSLTNMSLLPLELLSAGVIPVVNAGENNDLVCDNRFIEYCETSPMALARRLAAVLDHPDPQARAKEASSSVHDGGWEGARKQFVESFEKALRG